MLQSAFSLQDMKEKLVKATRNRMSNIMAEIMDGVSQSSDCHEMGVVCRCG